MEAERKLRVAISGSHGFLGSHLTSALIDRGYVVKPIPRRLLFGANELLNFFNDFKPDIIFSLHSYGNHYNQSDETSILISNYHAVFNMLKAANPLDYKAFFNFSSSSVYGKKRVAMSETDRLDPTTFYAATKAGAEYLVKAFATKYQKPVINIRPFSVFGEGEADFRFIPSLIKALLEGEKYTLTEGNHDWIYVKEFIRALLFLLDKKLENKIKFTGQAVNIGSGESLSNYDIYLRLSAIAGKEIKLIRLPAKEEDSPVWEADIEYLKSLGFKSGITREQALRNTFEYYDKRT